MTTEQNKSPPTPTSFYNASTEDALIVIEAAFKTLKKQGVKSNYGITAASIKQIRLNSANAPLIVPAPELLEALEACCERFRREIAADDLLRGFFGDEISPAALLNPLLIPQHGCIPQFLQACAAIAKARGQQ